MFISPVHWLLCKHRNKILIVKDGDMPIIGVIKSYLSLIKPRQTALLTYVGICSMIAADSHVTHTMALIVTLSLILGVSGATALSNYVDKDIDTIMERTKNRSLPSRLVDPPSKAIQFGIVLIIFSMIFAFRVNFLFFAFLVLGIINSVIIYNYLTKRRTTFNILLASPTGFMPILGGWVAVRSISLAPIIMSILMSFWIPIHVWSIVYRWKNDYTKAKIPMLPLKIGGRKLIAIFSLFLAVISLITLPSIIRVQVIIYLIIFPLNIILISLSLWLIIKPTAKKAWILFKFTSPYIAIIFTLWPLSALL